MQKIVMESFVRQYDCLGYAALMAQVAIGLEHIIEEGALPINYQGVFQKVATFFDNVVRDGPKTPFDAQIEGVSDGAIWFSNLTQCYPEIFRTFSTYQDLREISELLGEFAGDDPQDIIYPVEKLVLMQEFFWSLWDAVEQECLVDQIEIEIDFLVFPEVSTQRQ